MDNARLLMSSTNVRSQIKRSLRPKSTLDWQNYPSNKDMPIMSSLSNMKGTSTTQSYLNTFGNLKDPTKITPSSGPSTNVPRPIPTKQNAATSVWLKSFPSYPLTRQPFWTKDLNLSQNADMRTSSIFQLSQEVNCKILNLWQNLWHNQTWDITIAGTLHPTKCSYQDKLETSQ